MIDLKEIPSDGEIWEQFAEEFLTLQGLSTESPPDRGADGGKDILMIERISGPLHTSTFRWLVSCKHYIHSNRSVNENDNERNILERVKSFRAEGFIGFYSTLPSAGLNQRLKGLVDSREIKAYKIFNGELIKSQLMQLGKSLLFHKYFPESYKETRPIHKLIDEYVPLKCDECGKDLLEALYYKGLGSIYAQALTINNDGEKKEVKQIYCACKGSCDKKLELKMFNQFGLMTVWKDLSDIAMPNQFLGFILKTLNELREGLIYSDEAFEKEKEIIISLAQKVFQEITEEERTRFNKLMYFGL